MGLVSWHYYLHTPILFIFSKLGIEIKSSKIFWMPDPDRGQGVLPFEPVNNEEEDAGNWPTRKENVIETIGSVKYDEEMSSQPQCVHSCKPHNMLL